MKYCEFAEEVSKMTGVPHTVCSQIWVKTLEVLKNDFTSVEGIPGISKQKELYYFFKDKRLGMRFGPLRLCMNTYAIMRKARKIRKNLIKKENAKHKEN